MYTRRNIDVMDELWTKLKVEAAKQGKTIKEMHEDILWQYFEEVERQEAEDNLGKYLRERKK